MSISHGDMSTFRDETRTAAELLGGDLDRAALIATFEGVAR
jgi:hypothetical protein